LRKEEALHIVHHSGGFGGGGASSVAEHLSGSIAVLSYGADLKTKYSCFVAIAIAANIARDHKELPELLLGSHPRKEIADTILYRNLWILIGLGRYLYGQR